MFTTDGAIVHRPRTVMSLHSRRMFWRTIGTRLENAALSMWKLRALPLTYGRALLAARCASAGGDMARVRWERRSNI